VSHNVFRLLELEQIEEHVFQGESYDIGTGSLFGGFVLGQALRAASSTVDIERRHVHSLHAYFILPGDVRTPMRYEVENIREGGSFSTRRVVGFQHGRALFIMSASYHKEEGGIDHQVPMPEVPGPEGLLSSGALVDRLEERSGEGAVAPLRKMTERFWPVEFRPVDPGNPLKPEFRAPRAYTWFRVQEPLADDRALHQSVLACVSDYGLMGTALRPHGMSFARDVAMAASLDHAMWFHRPFRADSWMLYAMDSPSASNAVGFNRGAIYSEDGLLVASVAQEGLIRTRPREV